MLRSARAPCANILAGTSPVPNTVNLSVDAGVVPIPTLPALSILIRSEYAVDPVLFPITNGPPKAVAEPPTPEYQILFVPVPSSA